MRCALVIVWERDEGERDGRERKEMEGNKRKEDGRAAEHLSQRSAKAAASLLVSTAQMSPVDPPRPHVEYTAMSLFYKPFVTNFLDVSDKIPFLLRHYNIPKNIPFFPLLETQTTGFRLPARL